MHSYTLLRELVRDCGAVLVEEARADEKSRQVCALFEGNTHTRFRMCWDKKEKRAQLQAQGPEDKWISIGPQVRKLNRGSYENLRAFLDAAERLSGTRVVEALATH